MVLDNISDNIASMLDTGSYGAVRTTFKYEIGYYVVKFF